MSSPDPRLPATDDLRRRLQEAEETLTAIRNGEVDAVVVDGSAGQQVYCLEGPDEPFRIFVERMQQGALTLGADGTIVYCNRFFAGLVQRPIEQVRGQPLASFAAPDQRARLEDLLADPSSDVVQEESLLCAPGGRTVPVQLSFNRLPAEHVRMFGVVVTDLTERERAKQLEIQRRRAEDARAAREQFLALVSHELRAPLSAILGWAQVLQRRDDLPEVAQQGLEVIVRNAWAQSHLIEDLLDVSRVLAGKLRLNAKPTDLCGAMRSAVASAEPNAAAKRIEIELDLPAGPVRVRGDANRLQQIVTNLLSNAIKFSGNGARVRVALAARNGAAEITVADSGIGLAPEHLPKIFELYHQVDGTQPQAEGLGLGLAIVKQLVELHGGEVSAHSAGAGHGAEFVVRLPLLRDDDGTDAGPNEPAAATLAGLVLLVVGARPDERDALVQVLRGAGAEVAAAQSADTALDILSNRDVDLLICDTDLPGSSGYQLIRRIRASGLSGRHLPAVALTANAGREARHEALVAGFQTHLPKPLDQDELQAVVAHLAGPGRGGDGIPP